MFETAPVTEQLADRPMAHCATLTALDGGLVCAWFGGSYETAPDVAILAACRREHGAWSPPSVIARDPQHPLGQPVFQPRPDGTLWLFFVKVMQVTPDHAASMRFNSLPPLAAWVSAQPFVQRSKDGGRTWGTPEQLLDYPGLMFRSRPLILPGRIILPAYDEASWQSRMLISDDDGESWHVTEPISTPNGNIHPCLVELPDGRLMAYLRTGGSGGVIWRSESYDRGETWHPPTPTELPNPNSGIDLLRVRSGHLVLAFNNDDRRRTPLCVAIGDLAERWQRVRVIADGEGEYSYPTLLQTPDGVIHLVYTYQREHIQYAQFDDAWLLEGEVFG